jgi:hypothetical protein
VAILPPLKELNMFKHTLIAAVFVASSAMSLAQTAVAPAKPATPAAAAPAAAAPAAATAGAPAAATSAAPAAKPAMPAAAAPAAAPAAKTAAADPAVKKSNNDICHDKTSSGFASTKNFKPFATMDECIKSGGRAPKGPAKAAK